jgi:predicted RNA binding protein YcfA (HicA-like mRNA interferase family)
MTILKILQNTCHDLPAEYTCLLPKYENNSFMPLKVRDIIRLIEKDGGSLVRQTEAHRQYHHSIKPGNVTVSGKESLDLAPKTERSILRQAGLR